MPTTKAASKKAAKKAAAKKAASVVATQVAQAIVAAAAPVEEEETTTYVVLRSIHHSEGLYAPAKPGEDPTLIDLTEADAVGLLKVKAIAPYTDPEEAQ